MLIVVCLPHEPWVMSILFCSGVSEGALHPSALVANVHNSSHSSDVLFLLPVSPFGLFHVKYNLK